MQESQRQKAELVVAKSRNLVTYFSLSCANRSRNSKSNDSQLKMVGSLKLGLMDEKFCDLGGRCTAVEMVFDNSPGLKKLMTVSKAKLVEVQVLKK